MATLLAGVAALLLAWSAAAQAQPASRVYRIGFVSPTAPGPTSEAFRQGLVESGYVEGRNVVVESRFAEGHPERLPALVAETLRLKVDVLVVGSSIAAVAAKRATASVPIVFAGVIDPVGPGIVASFARPGGNVTGATFGMGGEGFGGKWIELLKEAAPHVSHAAAIVNSTNPTTAEVVPEMQAAARALSMQLDLHEAGDLAKLDRAFAGIAVKKILTERSQPSCRSSGRRSSSWPST